MGVPLRPLAIAGARSVYREVAPPLALADVLACGWHGDTGWARPLRVLPDGCADLVWDGDALTVVATVGAPVRLWVPASASRVGVRLPDIADAVGISERALRRHLVHAVGAGPKQVHRVRRFQRFLRLLGPLAAGRTSLAGVAAELGYADQSHLGRECRRLSGSSPAELVQVAEKFQTHARPAHQDRPHVPSHDPGPL